MRRLLSLLAVVAALAFASSAAAGGRPTILVWNTSSVVQDAWLLDAIPVWQRAIDEDFAPEWNADAKLRFWGGRDADPPPAGEWYIEVADNSDVWGALAYHGVMEPSPYGRVFAATCIEFGENWEVGFTHELWEMLADPYIDRYVQVYEGVYYALETADPVQDKRHAYWRTSPSGMPVAISDFVTEAWFRPDVPGPYDFAGLVRRPLQVLPDGYVERGKNGRLRTYSPARAHQRRRPAPSRSGGASPRARG